jgi:hypothetical protein
VRAGRRQGEEAPLFFLAATSPLRLKHA